MSFNMPRKVSDQVIAIIPALMRQRDTAHDNEPGQQVGYIYRPAPAGAATKKWRTR